VNATLFSLLSITVTFSALVLWVYWPSRRRRLESLGHIPLETDDWMPSVNPPESVNDTKDKAHE
jgi:cbb3-type cytochrome oxidase subunit 3